jgi:alpha-L-fucosidase 2
VAAFVSAFVAKAVAPNLHNSGANQSDASFGFTAGVAESLLQSHAGEISLLPALPSGWTEGSVIGLRARGGCEVNMQWKDGKLQSAEIRNQPGGLRTIRTGSRTATLMFKAGDVMRLNANLVKSD